MTRSEIISNLFSGKNFTDCINKMEPDYLREDLRQEVILIICELPEEKLQQLQLSRGLEFYTVKVIINQIKSSTSPFARKYRKIIEEISETDEAAHINNKADHAGYTYQKASLTQWQNEIDLEERELREMIEDMAIEEVDKLHWYNKGLVELYRKHGNYRAIEQETGIPHTSCFKTIKASFQEIKSKLKI